MSDQERAPTARKYRPSYGLTTSTSSSNFVFPNHLPFTGSPVTKPSQSYYRRGSAANITGLNASHGIATVARSDIVAKGITRHSLGPETGVYRYPGVPVDLKDSRPPLDPNNAYNRLPPSRIPTPVFGKTIVKDRIASSPVVPSFQKEVRTKESFRTLVSNVAQNAAIQPQHRLMGPLPPGPNLPSQRGLTKSNTFSYFGSLKSSLSRSNLTTSSSKNSLASLSSSTHSSIDIAEDQTISPPLRAAGFSRFSRTSSNSQASESQAPKDIRQINKAMPQANWIGRFVTLKDRFLNETLVDAQLTTLETDKCSIFTPLSPLSDSQAPTPTPPAPIATLGRHNMSTTSLDNPGSGDDIQIAKRAFATLNSMCTTNEAKKSLSAFQQIYARKERRECLLPPGGTMVDKESVMSRASRMFGGSAGRSFASRQSSSNGRRSGFGLGGGYGGFKKGSLAQMSAGVGTNF